MDSTVSAPALDFATLRGSLQGEVLVAGDPGYDPARAVWNAMIDRRPDAIVRCRGVADVIDAVRFAGEHGLPVAIRGGGHNVAGHAVCDGGLMLDLSLMRSVRVDPELRRAWVEGGATWRDVDRNTQAFGLATPGGLISDTGVAGLTLSGGIGWLRARHGLCIDNLLAMDVVTADGRLLRASASSNPDLFWALRGGGGNFGVVTGFEFALHPVGPEVMFCAPIYPIEAGPGPIRFWRDFLADKNDRVGSLVEFSTIPEDPAYPEAAWGRRVYTVAAVWNGDPAEGEAVLEPLRQQGETVADFSGRLPYCDLQRLFDAVIPFGRHRCYWKCHYLAGLDDALIDRILAANAAPPSPSTLSSIWNFGGATAAVPADATAFGDRSMPWMFSIDAIWSEPAEDATNIDWARGLVGRAAALFAGWPHVPQLPGPRRGTRTRACARPSAPTTSGCGRSSASTIPANLFRFNQNITPS